MYSIMFITCLIYITQDSKMYIWKIVKKQNKRF